MNSRVALGVRQRVSRDLFSRLYNPPLREGPFLLTGSADGEAVSCADSSPHCSALLLAPCSSVQDCYFRIIRLRARCQVWRIYRHAPPNSRPRASWIETGICFTKYSTPAPDDEPT